MSEHKGLRVKPNKEWMLQQAQSAQRIASLQPVESIPYSPRIKHVQPSEFTQMALEHQKKVDRTKEGPTA